METTESKLTEISDNLALKVFKCVVIVVMIFLVVCTYVTITPVEDNVPGTPPGGAIAKNTGDVGH